MTQEEKALRRAPLEHIQDQPWSFAALALAAGFGLGLFLRIGAVRTMLRAYTVVRWLF